MTKKKSMKATKDQTTGPLTIDALKANKGEVAAHQVGVRFSEAEFIETLKKAHAAGHTSMSNFIRVSVGLASR